MIRTRCFEHRRVRGYKGFHSDLTCLGGFQYKVGATYELDRPDLLSMCNYGFHFCRRLFEVYSFYSVVMLPRICEVVGMGEVHEVVRDRVVLGKCVASRIEIVRELSHDEIFDRLEREFSSRRLSGGYGNRAAHVHDRLLRLWESDRNCIISQGGVP